MSDQNDDILRAYLEQVVKVQQEGRHALSQNDLDAVARDLGLSDDDLRVIRRRHDDCVERAQGFLRYNNWGGAVDELKQAITLAPTNAGTHALLASAYARHYGETHDEGERTAAIDSARRALAIEPGNELALRVASEMQRRNAAGPGTSNSTRAGFFLVLGLVVLIVVVVLVWVVGRSGTEPERAVADPLSGRKEMVKPEPPPTPEPPASVPADTGFLKPLGVFGGEGIGEGLLQDARSIAVSGDSTVIVADYGSGRVQRFAPDGRFLNGWNIGENRYVQGLAADRAGTVYVVASGTIERYEAATGRSLGQLKAPGGRGFAAVAIAPGGKIATLWSAYAAKSGMFVSPKADDAIIIYDQSGRVISTWKNAVGKASGGGAIFRGTIAVDGLGTVYAGEGSYLFRFTSKGEFDDKIKLPSDNFVIDGQGRIIAAHGTSFMMLDREGTTLATWQLNRKAEQYKNVYSIDALAFSPSGDLFGVARTRILRLGVR